MSRRKTLLIDFDGTLSAYKGWQGIEAPLDPPLEKARHAMHILDREFRLVCFTTRPPELVEPWLRTHGFPQMKVTNYKEPAHLIIDDRALHFTGEWTDQLLQRIRDFRTHWEATSVGTSTEVPHSPNQSTGVPEL